VEADTVRRKTIWCGTARVQVTRTRHVLTIYEIEATRVESDRRVSSADKINVTMLDISPRQATTMIAGVGRKNDDLLTFMSGPPEGVPRQVSEMPLVLRT
jgi:hypothetical protein